MHTIELTYERCRGRWRFNHTSNPAVLNRSARPIRRVNGQRCACR